MKSDTLAAERRAIAFASDARGMLPMKVAIHSLLETTVPGATYHIYILGDGISPAHEAELATLVRRFGGRHEVSLLSMEERLGALPLAASLRWPVSAWSRIFLPSLVDAEWERVLYCDIDVLFCDDLRELYATDLRGKSLAGTLDEQPLLPGGGVHPRLAALGVPAKAAGYFNSGVLLMDVRAFRERHLFDRLLEYIPRYAEAFSFPDQDALNGALWDEFLPLHPRWNWCDRWSAKVRRNDPAAAIWPGCASPREVIEACVHPGILHFWGPKKPWFYNYRMEGPRYEAAMERAAVGGLPLAKKTWLLALKKQWYGLGYARTRRRIEAYARQWGIRA